MSGNGAKPPLWPGWRVRELFRDTALLRLRGGLYLNPSVQGPRSQDAIGSVRCVWDERRMWFRKFLPGRPAHKRCRRIAGTHILAENAIGR